MWIMVLEPRIAFDGRAIRIAQTTESTQKSSTNFNEIPT
jgi:hypothetical protein